MVSIWLFNYASLLTLQCSMHSAPLMKKEMNKKQKMCEEINKFDKKVFVLFFVCFY